MIRANRWLISLSCIVTLSIPASVIADVSIVDDLGNKIHLDQPATRIISLAPHLTELVFEAGAGSRLIAATEYSDYPAAAGKLPRVGDSSSIDLERIISLRPDLVLVWKSGTPVVHRQRLKRLGIPIAVFEFQHLQDIARGLRQIGVLAGTNARSVSASARLLRNIKSLRNKYSQRRPVSVFYQLWSKPIMSINREHMLNDVIELCGGKNIYANLAQLVPTVSLESVIKKMPAVIVASGSSGYRPQWLDDWKRWPMIPAVKNKRLFYIESDLIVRQSSRILQGTEKLCRFIDQARG